MITARFKVARQQSAHLQQRRDDGFAAVAVFGFGIQCAAEKFGYKLRRAAGYVDEFADQVAVDFENKVVQV